MAKLAVSLLLLSLVPLCLCQPNCNELNVDNSGPAIIGSNLPVCDTNALQCCTRAYLLEAIAEVQEELLEGLVEEVERQIERFEDIVDDIMDYFTDDDAPFFGTFFANLPFNVTDENQRESIENVFDVLEANLEIVPDDTFDAAAFINILIGGLKEVAVQNFPIVNATCLVQVIDRLTDPAALARLVQSISTWREGVTTLVKIERYLDRFLAELEENYDPTSDETFQAIVEEIVRRSFCGRCTRNIQPLCVNVCGALARAAYSPFFTRFRSDFQALWNVVARDVQIISSVTNTFFQSLAIVIDPDVLQAEVIATCLAGGLGKRSVRLDSKVERKHDRTGRSNGEDSSSSTSLSDFRFERALAKIAALQNSGLFMYGDEGPDICLDNVEDSYNCTDNFTCGDDDFCTSPCHCWTGDELRDDDVAAFTGVSVEQQEGNPYLPDTVDLRAGAQGFVVSTSVSDFLASENFTSTAPDGLETDDDDAAPPMVAVSMCALLLGAILAVFV